jgi:hypothetical protein
VHVRSVAKTRLVGRAVVEIATQDYELSGSTTAKAETPIAVGSQ